MTSLRSAGGLSARLVFTAAIIISCGGCSDGGDAVEGKTKTAAPDVAQQDAGCVSASQCPAAKDICKMAACASGACSIVDRDAATCDDGDPCTTNSLCKGGKCTAGNDVCECRETKDCASREDGNKCNGTLYCNKAKQPFVCSIKPSTVVACTTSADTPCRKVFCNPADGKCSLKAIPDGTVCDDGDACTVDSSCKNAVCKGGDDSWCECGKSADCAAKATNKCAGSWYCAPGFPRVCKLNTATAIKCAKNKDTTCLKNECEPASGACKMTPQFDGLPCDDGDKLTLSDVCAKGLCKGTTVKTCTSLADCKKWEDGDFCNGTLFCDKSSSLCMVNPSTLVTCPSVNDTGCLKNRCDGPTGACVLKPELNGKKCSDGDKCTDGDYCFAGTCSPGKFTCLCTKDSDCSDLEDGNACNGTLFCDKSSGKCKHNAASVVVCPNANDTACEKNACDPQDGKCKATSSAEVVKKCDVPPEVAVDPCRLVVKPPKAASLTNVPCDDGDVCTAGDKCAGTTCTSGTKICVCKADADCPDDDGNVCTGVPYCDTKTGTCKPNPATAIVCSKKNDWACEANSCHPKTGLCQLKARNNGKGCDDGEPCSSGDKCIDGACKGGPATCDDGNKCTEDTCVKGKGCSYKKVVCNDGNVCTHEACDPKSGQCTKPSPMKPGTLCNADNDPCTAGDSCLLGVCKVGQPVNCGDPANPCLFSKCTAISGQGFTCTPLAKKDGTSCPSGDVGCFYGSTCQNGKCSKGSTSRYGTKLPGSGAGSMRFNAVGKLATGALAVGSEVIGSITNVTSRRWIAWGLDENGETTTNTPFVIKPTKAHKDNQPNVLHMEGGTVFVAGTMADAKGVAKMTVVQLSVDDKAQRVKKEIVRHSPASYAGASYGTHYVRDPGGSAAIGGYLMVGGKHRAAISRVDPNGKQTALVQVHGPFNFAPSRIVGLRLLPNGGMYAVNAEMDNPTSSSVMIQEFNPENTVRWNTRVGGEHFVTIGAGIAVHGKRIFLTSSRSKASKHAPTAFETMRHTFLKEDGLEYRRIETEVVASLNVSQEGNKSLEFGYVPGTVEAAHIELRDEWGNQQMARSIKHPTLNQRFVGATTLTDGTVIAVGWRQTTAGGGKGQRPLVALMTPWLRAHCSDVGQCAGKGWKTCNDGKDCTRDSCHSGLGCIHIPDDKALCTPTGVCAQNAVCDLSKCEPEKNGRFRTHVLPYGSTRYVWEGWLRSPDRYRLLMGTNKYDVFPVNLQYGHNCNLSITGSAPVGTDRFVVYGTDANGHAKFCGFQHKYWQTSQFQTVIKPFNLRTYGTGASRGSDGSYWVVTKQPKAQQGVLAGLHANGGVRSQLLYAGGANMHDARGVVAMDDKGAAMFGRFREGSRYQATILRVDVNIKEKWRVRMGAKADNDVFNAALQTQDGGLIAVGTTEAGSGGLYRRRMVRFSATGKVVWDSLPGKPDFARLMAILPLKDDQYAIAGNGKLLGQDRPFLGRITGSGDLVFERFVDQKFGAFMNRDGLRRVDNGYLLLGYAQGSIAPFFARVDGWGHSNCDIVGGCGSKTEDSCDDANPCTSDVCVAKNGKCVHVPLSETTCGLGKVCKAGSCAKK